jgi:hypothetical protein
MYSLSESACLSVFGITKSIQYYAIREARIAKIISILGKQEVDDINEGAGLCFKSAK